MATSTQLIEEQAPRIRRIVRAITRDDQMVDDISQECFIRILEKEHLWDPSRGSRDSWVNALTRNMTLNFMRSRRPTMTLPEDLEDPAPGEPFDEEHIAWVFRQFSTLPARQREVLQLRYFDGLSQAEISRRLDIDPSTVSEHLGKSLATLRRRAKSQGLMAYLLPWNWDIESWTRRLLMSTKAKLTLGLGALTIGGIGLIAIQGTFSNRVPDYGSTKSTGKLATIAAETKDEPTGEIRSLEPSTVADRSARSSRLAPIQSTANISEDDNPFGSADALYRYIIKKWKFDESQGQSCSLRNGAIVINHTGKTLAEIGNFIAESRRKHRPNSETVLAERLLADRIAQVHDFKDHEYAVDDLLQLLSIQLEAPVSAGRVNTDHTKVRVTAGTTYQEILEVIHAQFRKKNPGCTLDIGSVVSFNLPPGTEDLELVHFDVRDFNRTEDSEEDATIDDIVELIATTVSLSSAPIAEGDDIVIKGQPEDIREVCDLIHFIGRGKFEVKNAVFEMNYDLPLLDPRKQGTTEIRAALTKESTIPEATKLLEDLSGMTLKGVSNAEKKIRFQVDSQTLASHAFDQLAKVTGNPGWARVEKTIYFLPKDVDSEIRIPIGHLLR